MTTSRARSSGARGSKYLMPCGVAGWRRSGAFLRGALPHLHLVGVALRASIALLISRRVLAPLLAAAAAVWLPPAAKEGQGDCDFPLGPPWILLYPLKRRRSAEGLEAAERSVLARRSALLQRGRFVALRSRCVEGFAARSCAAVGCGSSLVAASGGQGGIGGLRVPPTPSLDSLLTPLYRRRSAEGLEAAGAGRYAAGAGAIGSFAADKRRCFGGGGGLAAARQARG